MARQKARRRRRRKDRTPTWVLGSTCVLLAIVLAYRSIPWQSAVSAFLAPPEASRSSEPPMNAAGTERDRRPVYRHSVIPGGAYSVAEVERVRQEDPVVNAHYAVFENSKLRMTEAAGPKEVYVSYRIGNNVYWTRNRLRLAAGELLITDGEHAARARCGNRVADTPQQPVAEAEEPTAALDAAELPPPRQPASPQPSALVPDVFPPTPLIAMAQPLPAIPDTPSPSAGLADSPFRPFSFLGVIGSGMGVAVGIGAEAAAGANVMFAPTVPPGNSDPSGPVLPLTSFSVTAMTVTVPCLLSPVLV